MKGKIVNLCIAFINILIGILLLVYILHIPQDIMEFTIQELAVAKIVLKVIYVLLVITISINILQYKTHRDNSKIKTGYLIGIFAISFIFIKEPIIASFSIISGLVIFKNTLEDNSVDIDSTTGISIAGLIIVAIIISIGVSIFYKNIGEYIKNKENEGNLEYTKDYFKYITELDINDVYINLKKDGKYGYINQKGDVVIDFIYDYASPFINITMYNKDFQVALVCQDGISYIIMKNQRKVMSYRSESSDKNYGAKIKELEDIYTNTLGQGGQMKTEIEKRTDIMKKCARYEEISTDYTYRYDYNDEYDILVTQSHLGLGDKFELAKKENLNIKMPLNCTNIDYDENYVYLYSNNTIPFFDLSTKEQGWFTSYGKKNVMTGKAQILEFIDDKILIRNYNDNTIYFIDSEGEILSDVYKDIYISQERYIVKNKDNKYMVIDKEFNKVFENEYDVIDPYLAEYGMYICANTNNAIEFNEYGFAEINWCLLNYDGQVMTDNVKQIYGNFYQISNNKLIPYVNRYEEFLENLKDIEFKFVGDKFYETYIKTK